MSVRLRIFLIICVFLYSTKSFSQSPAFCSSNSFTDTPVFDSTDIRIDSNIVYGIAKNYFSGVNDTLMMDVYYPDTLLDTVSARPFILLIHGGAFISVTVMTWITNAWNSRAGVL
jgi:hypothetical protein